MNIFKKIFASKAIWGNIGTGALLALQFVPVAAQYVSPFTPIGMGLALASVGLSAYGRIQAKQPLGPVIDDTVKKTMERIPLNP